MGWLRDLMERAAPPIRSFGKLSVVALKSPDWPPDSRLRARSLATLLSRLDRGQDLAWLADRAGAQLALARALGVAVDALRPHFLPADRAEATPVALALWDLPSGRPLDLSREELPPGIPAAVLAPGMRAIWWLAASGAGKSLAGRWLSARGRAEYALLPPQAGSGSDAQFIELSAERPQTLPEARPGLVVAAPYPPPRGSGFELVRSPTLISVLEPLLDWARERLPKRSRFEPALARPYLEERVRSGALGSLGEVLGFVGLIDELGLRALEQTPLEKVSQRFVDEAVARVVDRAMPFAGWLKRSLHAALAGIAERALIDSELPLESPRTFESWLGLVPAELERHVDLDWMRLSLTQIDGAIRPSDVERAARRLPPGAFRVVTTLEQAGLLRRDASDRLVLGPAWLRAVLKQRAIDALLARSPFEWGEALLRPHAAADIADALLARTLRDGGAALSPVLDLESEDQPGYAAAADLALRIAGVARLQGADVGQEVLQGLWETNANLVLDLGDGLPTPRVEIQGARDSDEPSRGDVLLAPGTFYLGALSVAEALEEAPFGLLARLDPWHRTDPGPALALAYDAILETLRAQPAWERASLLLVERIRGVVGNVVGPEEPHSLELPAQILDEIQHGVFTFDSLRDAGASPTWLEPLLSLAGARGVAEGEVARAIWTAWDQAGRTDQADFLAPDAPRSTVFWANVPADLLEHLLIDARRARVPYPVFGDEQWDAFAHALARYPELANESAAWAVMPAEIVARVLPLPLDWSDSPESVGVLWRRFPELMANAVRRQLGAGSAADADALNALLGNVPDAQAAGILAEVAETGHLATPVALGVRRLLRRLVAERNSGWRGAYTALAKLERERVPSL